MSRTSVDKLGKRLAAEDVVSDADLDLLLDLLTAYQGALDETQHRLAALGHHPTSRTKTTGVLIEKLKREHSSLKSVQDGALPPDPDRPFAPGFTLTRVQLWHLVLGLAERTNSVERFHQAVMKLLRLHELAGDPDAPVDEEAESLKADLALAEVDLSRDLSLFSAISESLD